MKIIKRKFYSFKKSALTIALVPVFLIGLVTLVYAGFTLWNGLIWESGNQVLGTGQTDIPIEVVVSGYLFDYELENVIAENLLPLEATEPYFIEFSNAGADDAQINFEIINLIEDNGILTSFEEIAENGTPIFNLSEVTDIQVVARRYDAVGGLQETINIAVWSDGLQVADLIGISHNLGVLTGGTAEYLAIEYSFMAQDWNDEYQADNMQFNYHFTADAPTP